MKAPKTPSHHITPIHPEIVSVPDILEIHWRDSLCDTIFDASCHLIPPAPDAPPLFPLRSFLLLETFTDLVARPVALEEGAALLVRGAWSPTRGGRAFCWPVVLGRFTEKQLEVWHPCIQFRFKHPSKHPNTEGSFGHLKSFRPRTELRLSGGTQRTPFVLLFLEAFSVPARKCKAQGPESSAPWLFSEYTRLACCTEMATL